ncbi:SAM-dependent methyltransferase [Actinocrinis sp.]|uniref:SAM-dependent methyltransferase n=1 Tax=Actinocrinis sp. TaxID=1920516 RepID=UPI002D74BBC5|nr:SAM-dependent methyltransferase [Actinocrinis sp.]HZP51420.1 SAM-dependent methyltransferase [Actinocrinis sp.]
MATDRPAWAPGDVAIDQPSVARIWDWFLGGSHNFAVDREVARKTLELMPEGPQMARLSRAFLRRAVEHCVRAGITQFIDLGSGIPTVGNVHEVAKRATPDARVAYVDIDPVAVAHTRQILAGDKQTTAIQADLRDTARVLASPELRGLLDFDKPIALLMVMVLHFVPDADDPRGILAAYRGALAPGSALVIAHGSRDTEGMPTSHLQTARKMYEREVGSVSLRTRAEVQALFEGFELVEPGVVWVPEWHPEPDEPSAGAAAAAVTAAADAASPRAGYAGMGIKRL